MDVTYIMDNLEELSAAVTLLEVEQVTLDANTDQEIMDLYDDVRDMRTESLKIDTLARNSTLLEYAEKKVELIKRMQILKLDYILATIARARVLSKVYMKGPSN
jgi:hypothetical protein